MTVRRGVGDEVWRLAAAGDAPSLRRAADLLLAGDDGGFDYDGRRASAFALALEGRVDEALAQLHEGWAADWPLPAAYAADAARVQYLAGADERSLEALRVAVRRSDRVDPAVVELAALVVRRAPALRPRAARVLLGGGTPWQRLRNAARVLTRNP